MKLFIVAVMLFVVSGVANAFTPAPGFWYNPNESGRGFNIEIQDNIMAVATYVFDQHGTPIWYTSAGTFNEGTETFAGNLANAVGGQCLGCTYVPPIVSGNAGGPMHIVFTSFENGVLYFQGGSTPIQHLDFGFAGKNGYFQGEWAFSYSSPSGSISSQWIVFSGYYTASDGTVYAQGTGDSYSSSTHALGLYVPSLDGFIVATGDGSGYITSYAFSGDNSRMIGAGWFEPPGASISGNGYPAVGSRILNPSQLSPATASAGMAAFGKSARIQAPIEVLQQLESGVQSYIRAHQ